IVDPRTAITAPTRYRAAARRVLRCRPLTWTARPLWATPREPRLPSHDDRRADVDVAIQLDDVLVAHADAAVAHRLTEQLGMRRPVEADAPAVRGREADPPPAERIAWPGRDAAGHARRIVPVELHEIGILDLLGHRETSGRRRVLRAPDGDRIRRER